MIDTLQNLQESHHDARVSSKTKKQPEASKESNVKLNVRFSLDENKVHAIEHLDDLSDEDVHCRWFASDEYKLIKVQLVKAIKIAMKGGIVPESDTDSFRGLEFRTRDAAAKRTEAKDKYTMAILKEQSRQEAVGTHHAEKIRQIGVKLSSKSQKQAHAMALIDQLFVRKENDRLLRMYRKSAVTLPSSHNNSNNSSTRSLQSSGGSSSKSLTTVESNNNTTSSSKKRSVTPHKRAHRSNSATLKNLVKATAANFRRSALPTRPEPTQRIKMGAAA